MPITLPSVDYSPLYRSLSLRADANKAAFLPEQDRLAAEFAQLQKDQRTRDAVMGVADAAIGIAKGVYGIMQQGAYEKAKAYTFGVKQQIEDRFRADVFNGTMQVTTNPDGTVSFSPSEETQALLDQSTQAIDEQFKDFGEVASWAKDSIRGAWDQSNQWALGVQYQKAAEDRNAVFLQNIGDSITAAVKAKDFAPVIAQINQAAWLTPDKRRQAAAAAKKQYDFGVAKDSVLLAGAQSYSLGLAAAEAYRGLLPDDQIGQIHQELATQDRERSAAVEEQFVSAYTDRRQKGEPVNLVYDDLKAAAGRLGARGAEALAKVDAQYMQDITDRGFTEFNADRGDNEALKKGRTLIEADPTYDGNPERKKQILDLFDSAISAAEPGAPPMPSDVVAKIQTLEENIDRFALTNSISYVSQKTGKLVTISGANPEQGYSTILDMAETHIIGDDGKNYGAFWALSKKNPAEYANRFKKLDDFDLKQLVDTQEAVKASLGTGDKAGKAAIDKALAVVSRWRMTKEGKAAGYAELSSTFQDSLAQQKASIGLGKMFGDDNTAPALETTNWLSKIAGGDANLADSYARDLGIKLEGGFQAVRQNLLDGIVKKASATFKVPGVEPVEAADGTPLVHFGKSTTLGYEDFYYAPMAYSEDEIKQIKGTYRFDPQTGKAMEWGFLKPNKVVWARAIRDQSGNIVQLMPAYEVK